MRPNSRPQERHRKERQVCSVVERVVAASLAGDFDNPLLQSLEVRAVLPAPTLARLLIVITQPSPAGATDQILTALDRVRGALRSEVAAELNHKRSPELSFTVEPWQHEPAAIEEAQPQPGTLASASQASASQASASQASASQASASQASASQGLLAQPPWSRPPSGLPRRAKMEKPKNQKRTLRREQKLKRRRGQMLDETAQLVSQCDVDELPNAVPVKRWTRGVPVEEAALAQLSNLAKLPIVYRWIAAMPDVHLGIGATVGSVIPTLGAVIPAAVGVDIGCGMTAMRTTLTASELPDSLSGLRSAIERAVPHGRGRHGGRGDRGSWEALPGRVGQSWKQLEPGFNRIAEKHPQVARSHHAIHLGTLGTGNHFIELCLDESQRVWVMLHSGSRGVGNRIGTYFIELAKKDMRHHINNLPDRDLAYFKEGSEHFEDYVEAVSWAQDYARENRALMMQAVLAELRKFIGIPSFQTDRLAIDCHHNYVAREHHYGEDVFVTRKGAVRAGNGELGIIPGSMGAQSFIVRGKGNPESFCSCSHGAGRRMSRGEAKRRFTVEEHRVATEGVECRKDASVIDETPRAYKDIEHVMHAQRDLVAIEHTLKQVLCVKG